MTHNKSFEFLALLFKFYNFKLYRTYSKYQSNN
nr:MAG TPA: hypothetical protein [Caudoviricetes sp.]